MWPRFQTILDMGFYAWLASFIWQWDSCTPMCIAASVCTIPQYIHNHNSSVLLLVNMGKIYYALLQSSDSFLLEHTYEFPECMWNSLTLEDGFSYSNYWNMGLCSSSLIHEHPFFLSPTDATTLSVNLQRKENEEGEGDAPWLTEWDLKDRLRTQWQTDNGEGME